jgi:hypothetical protein
MHGIVLKGAKTDATKRALAIVGQEPFLEAVGL